MALSRIRTVKPEFFRHFELFKLEKETQLPLRVAFMGLFTIADREGRFKWRPEEIKPDVLPHDEVDFSRVLDALRSRGFIVKYAHQGEHFGCIPTWRLHQVINHKERASSLPDPYNELSKIEDLPTREPRVKDASPKLDGKDSHGTGTGTGKGTGTGTGDGEGSSEPSAQVPPQHELHWLGLLWNEHSGPRLSKIKKTNSHQKNIALRLKEEPTKEYWIGVIKAIAESDFLTGKTKDPFLASFSWMISKGKDGTLNHVKVSDGNYKNKSGGRHGEDISQFAEMDKL